jgi:hypothetical protein
MSRSKLISRVKSDYDSKALASLSYRAEISGGIPAKKRMILKYDQFNGYATGVATRRQVYRGNSLFDPDFTGTGGQPYNFDDWALLYNRYRVHACGIRVSVASNVAPAQNWGLVVCPSNASTSIAPADMIAAPGSKSVALGASYTSGLPAVLELHITTKSVLGDLMREGLQAQVTASPADPWFFHIVIFADDGTDTTWAGYLKAELFFDVEFFDRNTETLDLAVRRFSTASMKLKRQLLRLYDEKSPELYSSDPILSGQLKAALEERERVAAAKQREVKECAPVKASEPLSVNVEPRITNAAPALPSQPKVGSTPLVSTRSGYFFA